MIFTIVLFVLAAAAGLKLGSRPLIAAILAFYAAYVIQRNLPYIELITPMSELLAFIGAWIASYFIIVRSVQHSFSYSPTKRYVSVVLGAAGVTWLVLLLVRFLAPVVLPFEVQSVVTDFMATLPVGTLLIIPVLLLLAVDRE